MTVEQLTKSPEFSPIILPDCEREIESVYIGDLLSWVMGRAKCGNAWITIMSNINVLAVATLVDVSCVILSESVVPDEEFIKVANDKGVNVIATNLSSYDAAVKISGMLQHE